MKRYFTVVLAAMAVVAGVFSNALATDVYGTISTSRTWTAAESPYVVTDQITVAAGATLTLQPGVVVQFRDNKGLWVDGTLSAPGTSASPITFTGTTERSDWWWGIIIRNNGTATFDWCDIGYAGYSDNAGILKSGTGSLTLKNSTLHDHGGDGLRIAAGYGTFVSSGNTFSNNNYGVHLGINTSFDDNTSDFQNNNVDLHVDGGTITGDTVWHLKKDYSVYVSGGITVGETGTLTIKAGTVVKPKQYVGFWVDGVLEVAGTSTEPVYFTDWRDDTVGGDADGNADASVPVPGWWKAIYVQNSGSAVFDYCTIRYAGYSDNVGVYKTGSGDLEMNDSTVSHTQGNGLKVDSSTGEVMLPRSVFTENTWSGLYMKSGPASATGCTFTNNGTYGIFQEINDSLMYTGNTFSGNDAGGVGVAGGTINANLTWRPAGNPFVVTGNVTVAEGATLTLEPGTVVEFGQYTGLWVDGTLSAVGTSVSPITFTGTTETPGWWRAIGVQNSGSADFDWCDIGYSGYSAGAGILKTGTSALSLKNTRIHHTSGDGLRIAEGYSDFISSGNTFSTNNYGVRLGINTSFDDNTSDFQDNNIDMFVDGGTITGDTVWHLKKDYSVYVSGSITVGETGALTIKAGTVVKPKQYVGFWIDGVLEVAGTSTEPVYFTDWRDDTVGGDADGNADASAPAPDWWWKINVQNAGSATLSGCTIRYAGYSSDVGVYKTGSGDLSMTGCTLSHIHGNGLVVENSTGATTVSQSSFIDNIWSGLYMKSGPVSATGCTFTNNGTYGIFQEINDSLMYTGNTFSGNGAGGVGVAGGTINANLTWCPAGNPFVVTGNVTVAEGATLTLEPGTVVKFGQFKGLWVDGTLSAVGTSASPITFTGTTEAPDWWWVIGVQNSGSADFDWCDIGYGGYSANAGILKTGTGALSLKNTRIHHTSGDGLRIASGYSEFISSGNTFSNNNYGVRLGINTSFDDNTSDFQDNNTDVFVDGGTITGDTVWHLKKDYSLYVSGGVTVGETGSLTVNPGTVVKPKQYVGFWVDGVLAVAGTSADPVVFTDWRDDTVGGDANHDGDASAPAPDWWWMIHVRNNGSATFDGCDIAYSGYSSNAGIWKTGTGVLSLKSTRIHDIGGDGLRMEDSIGDHEICRSEFSNCNNGVLAKNQGLPIVISESRFIENTGYGVLNQNSVEVDARNNWWGDETGPLHDTLNPDALGDRVSDGVLFDPWRTTASVAEILSPRRSGTLVQGDALRLSGAAMNNPAYSYVWNFSDGRRLSERNPGVVTFPDPGMVQVAYSAVIDGQADTSPDTRAFNVVADTGMNPDFQAAGLLLPDGLAVGQSATITYTVRNVGNGNILGETWTDALYLSADPFLDASDTVLGSVSVAKDLVAGASYQNTMNITLPVFEEGAWYAILSVNDDWDLLEQHRLNNERAASVNVRIPELENGVSQVVDYAAGPVEQYFRMTANDGKNLVLDFQPDATGLEVYVRYGGLPERGTYDYRATSGKLTIPSATDGNWYVLVYGNMSQPGQYAVEYATASVAVTGVSPSRFSTLDDVSLILTGAGFAGSLTVVLVDTDGTAFAADTVQVDSWTQAAASFSAGSIPAGSYNLRVTCGSDTDELSNTVEIVAGGKPKFETNLILPARFGYHYLATVYVEYRNVGDAPMPAPLLVVTASQDNQNTPGAIRNGAIMTLDATRRSSGFWTSAMPEGFSNSVQFLASGENPGMLQPGESGRVPVYYAGWQKPWAIPEYPPIEWRVGVLDADDQTPVNWTGFKEDMRPDHIPADAWDVVWDNFVALAGTTWGDYVGMLSRDASYLFRQGQRLDDIASLLALAFRKADGMSPLYSLARGVDAVVGGPGFDIVFERLFAQPISRRFELGALGRGWAHNWQYRLTKKSDGTVEITDMTGTPRIFQPDSRYEGRYLSQPGDKGSLRSAGGGQYALTEGSGMIRAFLPDGKLNYIEDTNGNRITCGYSGDQLSTLTHSADPSLKLTLGYQGDLIKTVTDHLGRQTIYAYNGEHLASVETSDGRITVFDYNEMAGSASQHALTRITPPAGAQLSYTYDDQGRLKSICRGDDTEKYTFTYIDGTVSATDQLNHTSRFYFDYGGRMVKDENALGEATQLTFDDVGNLTAITDPEGISMILGYDGKGNLTEITNAMRQKTRFTYSRTYNRLASVTDANGNRCVYNYDGKGNLAAVVYPDGSEESWTFDAAGNPASWTNRRGNPIDYTYDTQGRITHKTYADNASVSYTYDENGNIETASDEGGTTTFTHDADDYLVRIDYPGNRYLIFGYDDAGRRISSKDHLGYVINYTYDTSGRLKRLSDGANADIVLYDYDALGRLSRKTMGNGVYAVYTYDAADRLSSLINYKPTGTELSRFEYAYDRRGRRISMTTHYGVWHYYYDNLGQLTRAMLVSGDTDLIANQDLTYEYDALGNRVKTVENGVSEAYTINSLNQVVTVGDRSYNYDVDGNLIQEDAPGGTTAYAYDDENRLVVVTKGGDTWKYTYDTMGNRTAVDKNGIITHYVFDPAGLGNVVGEYSGTGLVARYVHGLGLLSRMLPSGASDYYTFDPTGNAHELTGVEGVTRNSYAYQPFGKPLLESQTLANSFRFVGESGVMADPTGMNYMRKRYYDPLQGRFTSMDPIGLDGGDENFYRYALNNPASFIDPDGEIGIVAGTLLAYGLYRIGSWGINVIRDVDRRLERAERAGRLPLEQKIKHFNRIYRKEAYEDVRAVSKHGFDAVKTTYTIAIEGPGYGVIDATSDVLLIDAPTPPTIAGADGDSGMAGSVDPNEKIVMAGYGDANYVADGARVAYRIDFENMASASAPAQFVTVRDQLSTDLDVRTVEFLEAGFGDMLIPIPPGLQYFNDIVDYDYADDDYDFSIQVRVEIWIEDGRVCANFSAIDPSSGEFELPPPVDVGFLMPENDTGRGKGYVSFAVAPKAGLANGTAVRNVAAIQFDGSLMIDTNQVDPMDPSRGTDPEKEALVTFDTVRPSSSVAMLPALAPLDFTVSWSGEDADSGIAAYDVYVRENQGLYKRWVANIAANSAVYTGTVGSHYEFYSVATDNAGNREEKPPMVEAETVVVDCAMGDVDADGELTLADAVTAARVTAGILDNPMICIAADVNGDGRIGLVEIMYILQEVSGIRE